MCGIIGFLDSKLDNNQQELIGHQMLQRIIHRGPDASKLLINKSCCLGHNRLSIIDLNEASDQPFCIDQLVIVYNGEVYNYIELKDELIQLGHVFYTQSDTEVILKAYQVWGEACVDRFVGMWAFAIYNKETDHLFCSRDRFGIKPFYYIYNGGQFYFASEVKAFYDLAIFNPKLNKKQIHRGINLGWITYNDETYFEQIKALPLAHNLSFHNNSLKINRYWKLEKKELNYSYEEALSIFKNQFFESVRIHLRSDVKIGACLSGGIDSSSLVSAISTIDPLPLESFTIYYEGENAVDERPWVKVVVNQYNNIKPHYFTPTNYDIQSEFSKILYHQDAPLPGSSPISQYFLMQLAANNNIKVVLDGQGSDEYLLGYMHFYYNVYAQLLKTKQFKDTLKTFKTHKKTQKLGLKKTIELIAKSGAKYFFGEQAYKRKEFSKKFPNILKTKINEDLWDSFDNGNFIDSVAQNALFQDTLPSLLYFEDRNSMAFSLESRVPFLDHRLVELAYSLPFNYKLDKGITKKILREALDGILPEKIVKRTDKKGFVTPGEIKWLSGPLHHLLKVENLENIKEYCDLTKVQKLINQFNKGNYKYAQLLWRLVSLSEWIKTIK